MNERILRKTVTHEVIRRSIPSESTQETFSTKAKTWPRRKKLGTVRERCERLIQLQFPYKEVGYAKLKMDLMTRLGLCDRSTILAYLGRPEQWHIHTLDQEVVYLRSAARVLKQHTFKQKVNRKPGYLEIFGLATPFHDKELGKPFFKIHYENSNRAYHYREELARHIYPESDECSNGSSETSLSPIISCLNDEKEDSEENEGTSKDERRERKERDERDERNERKERERESLYEREKFA